MYMYMYMHTQGRKACLESGGFESHLGQLTLLELSQVSLCCVALFVFSYIVHVLLHKYVHGNIHCTCKARAH